MIPAGRFVCLCLSLGLAGGCAAPLRVLSDRDADIDPAAAIVAADIHIWGRFGRQTLPLRQAGIATSSQARDFLAAQLPEASCLPPGIGADGNGPATEQLALYQRVASAWLADPTTARAGLSIGPGLEEFAGTCRTALILLGQQLPQPAEGSNWLSLGAVGVAEGRLLRLAAVPLGADEDLRDGQILTRRLKQLLERIYR